MRALWLLLSFIAGSAVAAPAPGDAIKPFTLTAQDGKPYGWKPGRTTVITCCAFWCDTWKTQLPRVKEAYQSLRGMPVDFLTVSVDGRWSEMGKTSAAGKMVSDPGGRWTSKS